MCIRTCKESSLSAFDSGTLLGMTLYMNKQKDNKLEAGRKRKEQIVPDTGQGSAGDFGSDWELGHDECHLKSCFR